MSRISRVKNSGFEAELGLSIPASKTLLTAHFTLTTSPPTFLLRNRADNLWWAKKIF
jgi:hypothetical protein